MADQATWYLPVWRGDAAGGELVDYTVAAGEGEVVLTCYSSVAIRTGTGVSPAAGTTGVSLNKYTLGSRRLVGWRRHGSQGQPGSPRVCGALPR